MKVYQKLVDAMINSFCIRKVMNFDSVSILYTKYYEMNYFNLIRILIEYLEIEFSTSTLLRTFITLNPYIEFSCQQVFVRRLLEILCY